MDTVYIRYFGQIIKFKLEDYQNFIEHLVSFRQIDGIEDKYPRYSIAWLKYEFDIEVIEYPMDGAYRAFTDHRNGGEFSITFAEEFERLRNERVAELNKTQRRNFEKADKLPDNNQPILEFLDLELFHEIDPKRTIELKLPCNDDIAADYWDMKNLGYRDGDKHTEKMARRIQFWRTYALSMAPVDSEVKKQQKLQNQKNSNYGKGGGRPPEKEITAEHVDAAIKRACKVIKPPSSKNTAINKTKVFKAIAREVKELTDASESTFGNWLRNNGISRESLYEKMPDHIRSRMK